MDIVSAGIGIVVGTAVPTVFKWFGERYILAPRLIPYLDRIFKPYNKSDLHSDLDLLIAHMAIDWSEHHTLPSEQVYLPLYNKIRPHIEKQVSEEEYSMFNTQMKNIIVLINLLDNPSNTELRDLQKQIRNNVVPVLKRIKTQF